MQSLWEEGTLTTDLRPTSLSYGGVHMDSGNLYTLSVTSRPDTEEEKPQVEPSINLDST